MTYRQLMAAGLTTLALLSTTAKTALAGTELKVLGVKTVGIIDMNQPIKSNTVEVTLTYQEPGSAHIAATIQPPYHGSAPKINVTPPNGTVKLPVQIQCDRRIASPTLERVQMIFQLKPGPAALSGLGSIGMAIYSIPYDQLCGVGVRTGIGTSPSSPPTMSPRPLPLAPGVKP